METNPIRVQQFTLAIIGGGFSGTILAAQLVRHSDPSVSIVVIEKSGLPGRGVAYGTDSNAHLLNVPAKDMSAFPDDPEHFLRWAKSNYDWETGGCSFLPRKQYGRYLGNIFSEAVLAGGRRRVHWKRDEARNISATGDGKIQIRLRSGTQIVAEKVVLALGNFPSSDPLLPGKASADQAAHSYFPNPWSDPACESVDHLSSVLLLGSGLSSVDVAVKLRERGFAGTIHILSRRGLLPQSHKSHRPWPAFWNKNSPDSIRGLIRLVRAQVREAEKLGLDWRGVVNSLREVTPQIWQSLPDAEKRRFLRHLQPYWEVHRHRAAPEIAQFIAAQRSNREIQLHAGRITNYRDLEPGVEITYRNRRSGEETSIVADRVINCTAPEADCTRLQQPLISSLLASGLARPGPLFLGLDASRNGALIDKDGVASNSLFALGPLRKGNLWESTAVPEIRDQVHQLVPVLASQSGTMHSITVDPLPEEQPARP
jgi:uncharacterized NAD(P)/FAD-binding protein YdhS